ncbi:MAG TPA: competence/damage-inducible protein A [Bacilli bacterium]
MKAEVIAVGTELLMGQIANTNAKYLAERLAALGIDHHFQTVVGDNRKRVKEALAIAVKRADLLILTGGLGPTEDDLTREAVADFLGRDVEIDTAAEERIVQYFRRQNRQMTANNLRQAEIIAGARPLPNDNGLAVGSALSDGDRHYLLLPGPPRELIPMFAHYAEPWLRSLIPDTAPLFSVIIKFAGIGESALVEQIADLISEQTDPSIAPYAKDGEVALRLTTRAESKRQADAAFAPIIAELEKRLGNFLYAKADIPLEQAVVDEYASMGLTLAVAESCTGGMIGELITSVPGSSAVFAGGFITYSNEWKHKWLHVPLSLLEGEGAPGAVSGETAASMVEGLLASTDAKIGVAVTGVAGPAHSERKPVGLVYIAIAKRGAPARVEECRFGGNREGIRIRAAKRALYLLWQAARE